MADPIFDSVAPLKSVYVEKLDLVESFMDTAARFADEPGTVLLLSGGDLDCATHHLLAVTPWLTLTARGRRFTINSRGRSRTVDVDPFEGLAEIMARHEVPAAGFTGPVAAGLFGYLAYDLKDHLEILPRTAIDRSELPDIFMVAPSFLVVHHKPTGGTQLCVPVFEDQTAKEIAAQVADFRAKLTAAGAPDPGFGGGRDGFRSNFTEPDYISAVQSIREYIAEGHVYQVNMSQRFETAFEGRAFSLFRALYERNPAPFFAYVQAGDHQIVSTSPERFLLRAGSRVETRPIKGTRPRGRTAEEDRQYGDELMASRKDDAELSMIVDLLRNDIGKVCRPGSVRVADHKRLEAYDNVFHLVSVVTGELEADRSSIDLIRAAFPGGSITGCPKIRSMEIIDELEPTRRHIYTGSIGYISFHDTMDLSVAIRTATIQNQTISFSAGGGIVFDSEPGDEYRETLHKGATFLAVMAAGEREPAGRAIAWMNGRFRKEDDAAIPLTDLGLQYGFGFFETVRAENGRPRRLESHIKRFNRTWRHLFDSSPPDITWDGLIGDLLDRNGLSDDTAAVKLIATRGNREAAPHNHAVAITAKRYHHRFAGRPPSGVHLAVYPEPRQTPLAGYKTLNYLYYYRAGVWARSRHADEALICNPDGTVSETNTANLLIVTDRQVVVPASPSVLPGVMMHATLTLLTAWGYRIQTRSVRPEDLLRAGDVLITNALIGAWPVDRLDDNPLPRPSGLWLQLNDALGIST